MRLIELEPGVYVNRDVENVLRARGKDKNLVESLIGTTGFRLQVRRSKWWQSYSNLSQRRPIRRIRIRPVAD